MRSNAFYKKISYVVYILVAFHLELNSQSLEDTIKPHFSQDVKPHLGTSNLLKLNFLLPGVSYEQKIGDYQTLNFAVYMDGIISDRIETVDRVSHLILTPTINMEFRNYYNFHKREAKGKSTALNSGNYLGALYLGRISRATLHSDRIFVNQLGAVWGMQRNYPKGFSLDLNGGLAYTFKAKEYFYCDPIELILQAKVGFWLGNKSR